MADRHIALSLKQPWAALVVHGRKSIEIRRWATTRRGRILVHAAKVSDPRPGAWACVPADLRDAAQQVGGIVGSVEITGCVEYSTPEAFVADRLLHLNDVAWYRPPVMYGFVLTQPAVEPFRAFLGNIKFFSVPAARS
jgi:hypothetical protein